MIQVKVEKGLQTDQQLLERWCSKNLLKKIYLPWKSINELKVEGLVITNFIRSSIKTKSKIIKTLKKQLIIGQHLVQRNLIQFIEEVEALILGSTCLQWLLELH